MLGVLAAAPSPARASCRGCIAAAVSVALLAPAAATEARPGCSGEARGVTIRRVTKTNNRDPCCRPSQPFPVHPAWPELVVVVLAHVLHAALEHRLARDRRAVPRGVVQRVLRHILGRRRGLLLLRTGGRGGRISPGQ